MATEKKSVDTLNMSTRQLGTVGCVIIIFIIIITGANLISCFIVE